MPFKIKTTIIVNIVYCCHFFLFLIPCSGFFVSLTSFLKWKRRYAGDDIRQVQSWVIRLPSKVDYSLTLNGRAYACTIIIFWFVCLYLYVFLKKCEQVWWGAQVEQEQFRRCNTSSHFKRPCRDSINISMYAIMNLCVEFSPRN